MNIDPRAINEYTGDPMHDIVITRPGRDTLRYGPIPFKHQAEQWITYLNWSRQSTAMPKGTTWEMTLHNPDQPHIDPDTIPTTPDGIAVALLEDCTYAFPNLYLLLQCILGDSEAGHRWKQACAYAACLENADEEED